tara:strand:- start:1717 stop:1917 length:201 start_codon:yes stop_codon:yes gene_type:complete
MKNIKLIVKTATKKYPIIIGSNIIKNINNLLNLSKLKFEKILIVYDTKVPKQKLNIIKKKLKSKKK